MFSLQHPRFWSIRTDIIWKFGILDNRESMRHHPSWFRVWNPTPLNAYGTVPWMVMAMVRGGQYCLLLPYILINVSSSLAFSRVLDCVIRGNSQFKGSVAGSPCLLREKISFEKWLSQERSNQISKFILQYSVGFCNICSTGVIVMNKRSSERSNTFILRYSYYCTCIFNSILYEISTATALSRQS